MQNTLQFSPVSPASFGLRAIQSLTRRLPLEKGLYRITNHALVQNLLPTDRTQCICIARLETGISIEVDLRDYNGRMLYLFGTIDPKIVRICRALLQPGDTFLDIGANHGSVGLLCREAVGDEGSVHLFEPQPDLCGRIKGAIEQCDSHRVQLHPIGLMDRDDTIEMCLSREHSGKASFILNEEDAEAKVLLQVKNLATYLPPLIGERPFGAKIDVEGAEPHLLPWLMQQDQLRFLVFENKYLQERSQLFEALTRHGFVLFGIGDEWLQTYLHRARDTQSAYHDVVAVRTSTPPGDRLSVDALQEWVMNRDRR